MHALSQHYFPDEFHLDMPNGEKVVLYRSHYHLYLAEFHRSIEVQLPNGTSLKTPIHTNTGGQTDIAVYQSGDFLKFEDYHGTNWINLKKPCMWGSRNPPALNRQSRCGYTRPAIWDWRYLGRIIWEDDGLTLSTGTMEKE